MVVAAVTLCLLAMIGTAGVLAWCMIGTIEPVACPAGHWIPATPDSAGQPLRPSPVQPDSRELWRILCTALAA